MGAKGRSISRIFNSGLVGRRAKFFFENLDLEVKTCLEKLIGNDYDSTRGDVSALNGESAAPIYLRGARTIIRW